MNLVNNNSEKGRKKLFLLVFHGGLVLYSILHNVLIPLVRNLGRNEYILNDIHYWFLYHIILFILFVRYDVEKKPRTIIPFLCWLGLWVTFIRTGLILFDQSKLGVYHFSIAISIVSNFIFFGVFFKTFKPLFDWKEQNSFQKISLSLFCALILQATLNFVEIDPNIKKIGMRSKMEHLQEKEEGDLSQLGCQGSHIKVHFPKSLTISSGVNVIDSCGFKENRRWTEQSLEILNSTDKVVYIQLLHRENNNWRVIETAVVRSNETYRYKTKKWDQGGIFLLKSQADKEMGIQLIFKGNSQQIPHGDYQVTPHSFMYREVNE